MCADRERTQNPQPPQKPRRSWRRRLLLALFGLLAGGLGCALWVDYKIARLGPLDLGRAKAVSVLVTDRKGRLLRAYTAEGGIWRLPVGVDEVDPRYLRMLLAYEDKRFYEHSGVDIWAVARAAYQLLSNGRIVSGASTLTMQVARLLEGRHERTARGKLRQMLRAWQLERRFSKRQILGLYLLLAPFGGNLEGVRAATLAYFGKEPARLSLAEAALLVALPQSPEARRPDRHAKIARAARDRVLTRMARAGVISRAELAEARLAPMPRRRRAFPIHAPHLADRMVSETPALQEHRLTIDRDLQARLETLVREHAHRLGPRLSAALIVVAHKTGAVRAHVGSPGYLDGSRFGAIDMTRAIRSPGSTLKPFIYGLAFEAGLAHPETLIEDRPTRFGSYRPENFDGDYRGTVSIREALQLSLNVPAIKVLDAVGPVRLTSRFRRLGVRALVPGRGAPSIAIGLGGLGMTLEDLANLYSALARLGEGMSLSYRQRPADAPLRKSKAPRLMSALAAWYVGDILLGTLPPPTHARAGGIAYKTGTSYGYRDAWAIGYDGRHVVAAWVGRPDGTPTPGLTGRTAAAPLLFDAFERLGRTRAPLPAAPRNAIFATSADLPPPLRRFRTSGRFETVGPYLRQPVQIAFPPDKAELPLAGAPGRRQPIMLKAEGGRMPLTWLVDGKPIAAPGHRRVAYWQPAGPGFVTLSVIDADGTSDRVRVRLAE